MTLIIGSFLISCKLNFPPAWLPSNRNGLAMEPFWLLWETMRQVEAPCKHPPPKKNPQKPSNYKGGTSHPESSQLILKSPFPAGRDKCHNHSLLCDRAFKNSSFPTSPPCATYMERARRWHLKLLCQIACIVRHANNSPLCASRPQSQRPIQSTPPKGRGGKTLADRCYTYTTSSVLLT